MKKILVVDDDHSLRGFVAKALEKEGFNVIQAEDGAEAWSKLQSADDIDLLLTDIVMPSMDGVELTTKAICANPDLKVMFMTGFTGMASKLDDKTTVIAKPFHLNDIVTQVRQTLEN